MPTKQHSVLYLQYTSPANYPPLEQSGLLFLKAGWEVRYFGIESEGESKKLAFPEPLSGRVDLWNRRAPGLRQKVQFAAFTLAALWRASWHRPAWVYCSDLMSCPAAWLIGRLTQCRVLYHEHDSPETRKKVETEVEKQKTGGKGQQPNSNVQVSTFQRGLLWFRRQVGRNAELMVFPNAKRLELFIAECGRKRSSKVVFNCPRKEEVKFPARKTLDGKLQILFHGSLNYRQPDPLLLEAMAKLPESVTLTIVGYPVIGSHDCMKKFHERARKLGLEQNVQYLGAMPRQKLMEVIGSADVGLAMFPLQTSNINLDHLTGASNKAFDYLSCGLALLVSARPDWEEMFVRPGYGLSCDPHDADSIATQLRWFLEHPDETRRMGERGRQRILDAWNYERQFDAILKVLNGVKGGDESLKR